MTIIYIPERLNLYSIDKITKKVIGTNLKPITHNVTYDLSNLKFIDSTGVTVFSNLIQWGITHKVRQIFTYPAQTTEAISFLDDSQFFLQYMGKKINPAATPRATTLPLKMVKHSNSYGWIENTCMYWLSGKLGVSRDALVELKVCLQELFNNIKDHSAVDTGCIFIQHYPRANKILISLSDFGIGIPANVNKIKHTKNDAEAILEALKEGFTTRTTNRNRGVGLHLLVQTVVNNGGTLTMRSGDGIVFCSSNGSRDLTPEERSYYPGTVLQIELLTDKFDRSLADKEDFTW